MKAISPEEPPTIIPTPPPAPSWLGMGVSMIGVAYAGLYAPAQASSSTTGPKSFPSP
jgi:hypothetical protein